MLGHRNHVLEGTAQSCTSPLCPCSLLQLTQGLSPPQDNGPSPETKDTGASMGKPLASARTLLWSLGEECSLSTAGCRGTDQLAEIHK